MADEIIFKIPYLGIHVGVDVPLKDFDLPTNQFAKAYIEPALAYIKEIRSNQ